MQTETSENNTFKDDIPENSAPENSAPENSELARDMAEEIRTSLAEWAEREHRSGNSPSQEARRAFAEEMANRFLGSLAGENLGEGHPLLSREEEADITAQALRYAFGSGPWEKYLTMSNLSDIHINGCDSVWLVERNGKKTKGEPIASSNEELIQQIRWAGSQLGRTGRRFDSSSPVLNMRLPGGARLHAIMEVSTRPSVTIRLHNPELSGLGHMRSYGMLDLALESFLSAAMRARFNLVICGGMGTGKTSLCRALLNEVPPEERIVTVEDELELGLDQFPEKHPDICVLEARPPNLEGAGSFSLEELLRECLRMHADRIVVGEVRGPEVLGMLLAMTSGQSGSLCTIHANSTKEAFERLAMYSSMTRQQYSQAFTYRLVGSAVDFVIHLNYASGRRRISSIREVTGSTESQVQSNEIWRPNHEGKAIPSGEPIRAEPTLRRLAHAGFDRQLMDNREGWWEI